MVGGFGEMRSERNRKVLYFALLKISFHFLQIKRAAAHTPLQHFNKVRMSKAYGTTVLAYLDANTPLQLNQIQYRDQ